MGWKTFKEHYRIGHYVQVTEWSAAHASRWRKDYPTDKVICIGSPYIHDIIVIGLDGAIIKGDDGRSNEDLKRYMAEMKADPAKLREVVLAQDTFAASIPVHTYSGGKIIEKRCEVLGWPNVTHDGDMMYENTFSADKSVVVKWAKRNAAAGIRWQLERIDEIKQNLAEVCGQLEESVADFAKLEADYPTEMFKGIN